MIAIKAIKNTNNYTKPNNYKRYCSKNIHIYSNNLTYTSDID